MTPPEHLTIIFDGRCGVCTRTIAWLLSRDTRDRLTVVPCQTVDGVDRFGLTRDDCLRSVWAVTPDGGAEAGGQAATLIAAVLLQHRWPVTIGRMPGVRHILALGYRAVASNRHRLPGMMPWCESHPEECTAEET
jgi:predicted DCC family thiol-disulfide oxidoreductase YuxK